MSFGQNPHKTKQKPTLNNTFSVLEEQREQSVPDTTGPGFRGTRRR